MNKKTCKFCMTDFRVVDGICVKCLDKALSIGLKILAGEKY